MSWHVHVGTSTAQGGTGSSRKKGAAVRHRLARIVLLALVIGFPLLVSAAAAPTWSGGTRMPRTWAQIAPLAGVESVLVGGLILAWRNRRRLRAEAESESESQAVTRALRHGSRVPHSRGAARRRPG